MQEIAEQNRQHQHETVQHRHHDRRPAPLQRPAPVRPQFGGGQRRINSDDAGADCHAHRGGFRRQRHDGGDPGDRAQNQPRQIRLAAVEDARSVPDHAARHEADGVECQRKHLAERAGGERPQRDRCCAKQIGRAPPFQRRDVFLLAEKQQHGSQHGRNHSGNEIQRGNIKRHGPPEVCDARACRRAPLPEMRAIARAHANTGRLRNSFARIRKFSRKTASTPPQMRSKKGARRRPFVFPTCSFRCTFEAISASRTGTTGGPWPGRTSCARRRGSRGSGSRPS